MIAIPRQTEELVFLLTQIAEDVQVPPSTDKAVRQHYQAVSDHLTSSRQLHGSTPHLFPQGSYRLGTTVRPIRREEFDLDFVVELVTLPQPASSRDLYERVASALESSSVYAHRLERRDRCVRINYAGSFHIDVVPAIPNTGHPWGGIRIPTHAGAQWGWAPTDPRGYIRWFESRNVQPEMRAAVLAGEVELLPANGQKSALQLGIQLVKRYQSMQLTNEGLRTPSIVLTTVAAGTFGGSASLPAAVDAVVGALHRLANRSPAPRVPNPTIQSENLARKWSESPETYWEYGRWVEKLQEDWEFLQSGAVGLDQIKKRLEAMFGERPTQAAVKAYTDRQRDRTRLGTLDTSRRTGVLGASAPGVPGVLQNRPHTFYGPRRDR
jgi:hypothetical protein